MSTSAELAMLVLGAFVLGAAHRSRDELMRLHRWRLLFAAYMAVLLGWVATTLEGLVDATWLNTLEHAAYAVGGICVALWCWRAPEVLQREGS
ncbi:hypothetical protein G6O69_04635 [Pseudenhygromyxa sp. WMMC2535]|uniref:hypothetical protein n=1 Tax=Pseudenhygromyxa sp. WMMC2535 TaxID=2712867 RepID=UPI0015551D0B|nr:hypothetical protein [Pseudenhygromyxa sp. WMMC2535]NVB37105.1 hypothetical protein [Pseudenhygromyxa sp. WMMC2535]